MFVCINNDRRMRFVLMLCVVRVRCHCRLVCVCVLSRVASCFLMLLPVMRFLCLLSVRCVFWLYCSFACCSCVVAVLLIGCNCWFPCCSFLRFLYLFCVVIVAYYPCVIQLYSIACKHQCCRSCGQWWWLHICHRPSIARALTHRVWCSLIFKDTIHQGHLKISEQVHSNWGQ